MLIYHVVLMFQDEVFNHYASPALPLVQAIAREWANPTAFGKPWKGPEVFSVRTYVTYAD